MTFEFLTDRRMRERLRKRIANVLALGSLLLCAMFWLMFAARIGVSMTGFDWLKIMGAAVVCAIVATVMRSRLWRIALPVSVFMLFFVMYVMGS